MAKIKERFNQVRLGVMCGVVGTIGAAGLVSLGGLAAHGFGYLDDRKLDDYSLEHRFETAYCINVPESRKYYTTSYYDKTKDETVSAKQRYLASPWVTYPAIVAYGALMAAFGIKLGSFRRRGRAR